MTNISKKLLTSEQEDGLFRQLSKSFANKDEAEVSGILIQLLGREERIMLAKRFAAILLIHHKQSPYFIAHTLLLSPTTVGLLLERYDRGEYSKLVKMYAKPTKKVMEILSAVDNLLHLGGLLPHYKRHRGGRKNIKF